MSNNNKGRGFGGKGYYIALILCAAVIGITGYVYYRNLQEPQEVLMEETIPEILSAGTISRDEVMEAIATEAKTEPPQTPLITQEQDAEPVSAPQPLKTQSPIQGEEICGYSMEALSYNQTTRDWRVHNGVDIAAETGTEVCAAADGKVYTVYEDDAMGCTVVIRHDGGYTTRYSSLAQELTVKAGDEVKAGQVIGYVGDTALVETTLGTHVHFGVTCQGEPMDPAEFLALGQ